MLTKEDLIRKKGQYQSKYGLEMDDFSITLYTEIEEQFDRFEERLNESIKEIEYASQKIEGQINQVHFDDRVQAFVFGLGKFLPIALALALNGILAFIIVNHSQESGADVELINNLLQKAKIMESKSIKYLVLKPMKNANKLEVGKHFMFDTKQNQVLVPIEKY